MLLNSYYILKHWSLSDTKAFGLDKSDVEIEEVPIVYQPILKLELERK
jgi:KUP system potassium uptake protein